MEIVSLSEQKYEGAIVLGGFGKENEVFGDRFEFNKSANRLTQALELYYLGRVKRVIVTGGSAAILTKKTGEEDGRRRGS